MILIDAIYINNGGGKVLLDYLIECLENTDLEIHYLLDQRVLGEYPNLKSSNKVTYLKSSFFSRHAFYKKYKLLFKKVLCFGNVPPSIRLTAKVFTYFHQPMYLSIPTEFPFIQQLLFKLKANVLNIFKSNTDIWLVQNEFMKSGLCQKFALNEETVCVTPFYPDENLIKTDKIRQNNSFIFVSAGMPHKNHKRLIEAFCLFYDAFMTGSLTVTVDPIHGSGIVELIEKKRTLGYPLFNIGFVEREKVISYYQKSEYLIFPSIEESFGLGIIEAIECGCKVIGADLPYMYQVCDPSIKFNPFSVESIKNAFIDAYKKNENPVNQKVFNRIDIMIDLLRY